MLRRFFSQGSKKYDVTIIGGGPGGYVAAIKAAQLGMKAACIESRGSLGGTCLNVGCIPSKTLLNIAHVNHLVRDAAHYGINAQSNGFDWAKIQHKKDATVTGLTGGIEYLFKKNKVDYLKGHGKILSSNSVEVNNGTETQTIESNNIVIATGSEPRCLPNFKFDEKVFVSSTGALSLAEVPKKLIVIGAGVIGLELGSVYKSFGTELTYIEFADRICPPLDKQIGNEFQKLLLKDGNKILLNTKCTQGKIVDGKAVVSIENVLTGEKSDLVADVCLICTGRNPYTANLGLEGLGITLDKFGRIPVNNKFQTSVPNIFAIGDVIEGPMLAHKASEDGFAVVELISGKDIHLNYNAIPGVIYTSPEIAWVGKTEEQLIAEGVKYKKGSFPFSANSRSRANLDPPIGIVKILGDAETDRLLGGHIVAPNAGEMIHELVLAIEYGASCEDVARSSHAHPSLSESIKEAALATFDKPIHI